MDGILAWVLGIAGSLIGGLSLTGFLLSLLTARRIKRLESRLDRLEAGGKKPSDRPKPRPYNQKN